MAKVIVQGHIMVPDADMPVIQKELPAHIELTRQEAGCLSFEITQDENNQNKFHLYEEFASPEAFEAHRERAGAATWGQVSQNVERHFEVTESND